ncbi:hypothetical protein BH11ACT8_BH11ACT8_28180 [soil metagenome]
MAGDTTVFLHVGLRKSGTTYLQHGLRASTRTLSEQGVDLVHADRDRFVADVVAPLRRFGASGEPDDRASAEQAVAGLATLLGEGPNRRKLISLEDLAELPETAVALLLRGLERAPTACDVHVVVTARHWGYTIPSEWQQSVKERGTRPYAGFVTAVRERRPAAEEFLTRQHLPDLLRRWSAGLAPDRVHLVAVPPSSRAEGTLQELFCGVVGVDPTSLRMPEQSLNASLSLAQAEMLRRVNRQLGDRMPKAGGVYKEGVRAWLARGSLMAHERSPILLPADALEWCVAETGRQLDEVRALGVDLVGDPDDLLADPAAPSGPSRPSQADVAAVAVSTVADLTALRWSEQEAGAGPARPTPSVAPSWRTRLSRRLSRRPPR